MGNLFEDCLETMKLNLMDTLNFYLVFSKSFNTSYHIIDFMDSACINNFVGRFFDKFYIHLLL